MTVDELVDRARALIRANEIGWVEPSTIEMCHAILESLGAEAPCGWEREDIISPGSSYVHVNEQTCLHVDEALWAGRVIIEEALATKARTR